MATNRPTDVAQRLLALGYTPVSVAPPGAPIAPNSNLRPESLGKAPAVLNGSGYWRGYPWLSHKPTAADAEAYDRSEANVGILADMVPGIDIDVMDPDLAERIERLTLETLGPAPVRIGQAPKRLLSYRLRGEPFGRQALRLPQDGGCVEILPRGRQYIVAGTHPSGLSYVWKNTPLWNLPYDRLTAVSMGDVERLMVILKGELGGTLEGKLKQTARSEAKQAELLAPSIDDLRAVVEQTPNDDRFADRDKWIQYGIAIKAAAGPENEDDAYAIFADWSERWEGGAFDPDDCLANWRRLHAPFSLGWEYIVDMAPEDSDARERKVRHLFDADPDYVEPEPRDTAAPLSDNAKLEALNGRYAFVVLEGRAMIWDDKRRGFMGRDDFTALHGNDTIGSGKNVRELGRAWLKWHGRRDLPGVGFFPPPAKPPHGWLNLWDGFAVEPDPSGSCDLFLDHVRTILADGDHRVADWILDFAADLVQNPGRKLPHALALQGKQGAGKTLFPKILGRLLQQDQYVVVVSADGMFGQFNGHLEKAILVNMEEAVWAGHRGHGSKLKNAVSGEHEFLNAKYLPPRMVPSYYRIVITSNEDWLLQSASDDRRWVVVHVNGERACDMAYFDAIFDQLDDGGYEALLHYLLHREIDRARLLNPPVTEALRQQATESLPAREAWWLERLDEGSMPGGEIREDGTLSIPLAQIVDSANLYVGIHDRSKRFKNRSHFTGWLSSLLGTEVETRRINVTSDGSKKETILFLPSLSECRARHSALGRGARQAWPDADNWTTNDLGGMQ